MATHKLLKLLNLMRRQNISKEEITCNETLTRTDELD